MRIRVNPISALSINLKTYIWQCLDAEYAPCMQHGSQSCRGAVRKRVQDGAGVISKLDGIVDVATSLEVAPVVERHIPIATCVTVTPP